MEVDVLHAIDEHMLAGLADMESPYPYDSLLSKRVPQTDNHHKGS